MTPLRDYLNRSGQKALGLGWQEENEHGFCVWRVKDGKLILADVYGDGHFWDTWAEEKARELEVDTIRFITKRSPKAFQRKYGYELAGYVMEKAIHD